MTLESGSTLGRYKIVAPLGSGGMASVLKAYHPSLDRVVALKVLRPGLAEDPEFIERFQREARAIARLRHPNIVQVYDFDQIEGRSVLAMEFLEGGTLKSRVTALATQRQRLPKREAARIVSEVADALAYAHGFGIVHRDVKPSNIMFTRDGKAVVTDFGIAKIIGGTQFTQTGVGIGTPEYMSPEQGLGKPVDHRSDIYALGVVAYELLTGSIPFAADTPISVLHAQIYDPPPPPSQRDPQVGTATEQVVLRALAKSPADRHQSSTEFAAALLQGVVADERGAPPTLRVAVSPAVAEATRASPEAAATTVVPRETAAKPARPRSPRPSALRLALQRVVLPKLALPRVARPRLAVPRVVLPRLAVPRPRLPDIRFPVAGPVGAAALGLLLAVGGAAAVLGVLSIAPPTGPGELTATRSPPPGTSPAVPAARASPAAGIAAAAPSATPEATSPPAITPSATPTLTPTPASTATPTVTPTATPPPTPTPTPPPTPSPTPRPTPSPLTRGALIWQAALDAGGTDLGAGSCQGGSIRPRAGAIEIATLGSGQTCGAAFGPGIPVTYVAELDLKVEPGSATNFRWGLSPTFPGRSHQLGVDTAAQTMRLQIEETYFPPTPIAVGPTIPIPGLQSGRVITIGVVAEPGRYRLYLDGGQVADVTDSRFATTSGNSQTIGVYGPAGTVTIVGARRSQVP